MARNIGAVLAGILVVGVVVAGLQYAGLVFYPPPEGLDPLDPADADAFAEYLADMPAGIWGWVFGAEILGAFLGALAAGRIAHSHRSWFAAGIVALAVAGSINNWSRRQPRRGAVLDRREREVGKNVAFGERGVEALGCGLTLRHGHRRRR